ncbi:phage tail protein [Portibacter lacus]|uniref:Phage tail protein n=1 Tax=Portibacter lacus TaxID=1099794 RepID=A0AA37WE61_9BACT|nr:phage tail protein [Portibacter lacus]GLR16707.1 hypothetical protein GCM10007940_13220 [Portibacter lacus]
MAYKGFPVASYFFDVKIGNLSIGFQSVSGLKASAEYQNIDDNSARSDSSQILKKMKYDPVTFKKGLVKGNSMSKEVFQLFNMEFHGSFEGLEKKIQYQTINVTLLSEDEKPLFEWVLEKCYPDSWEVSGLDAMKNEVAIETMTFNFQSMKLMQY